MRLKAPANFWHDTLPKPLPASVNEVLRYESSSRLVRIPLYVFPDETIELIYKACKKHPEPRINRLTKKIDDYRMLASNPAGEGVGKLERLVVAMTAYIRTTPHKFIFVENSDGQTLPYYVTGIQYHPRDKRNNSEAHVTMKCYGLNRGKKDSHNFYWNQNSLLGKPKVGTLLAAKGAYLETPAAYEAWLKEVEAYNKIKDGVGIQFLGDGFDEDGDSLTRDGASTRLVLDDTIDEKTDNEANERGDDIQQNAIVGVFLRLLERYRGVLFLTSNRATVIDDAVMSRCIAHVKYTLFRKGPDLARLWGILADNYKVKLTAKDIEKLMEEFPVISGRNIKNLLKLAGMVAKRKKIAVDVAAIKSISAFVEMTKEK